MPQPRQLPPGIKQLPSGHYQYRWRDQDNHPCKETFRWLDDAKRAKIRVEVAKLDGNYASPAAGRQTFGEFVKRWREDQVQWAVNTADLADGHLKNHILPFFGEKPIGSIRTPAVQAWVNGRAKVMAPSTLEAVYGRLASVMLAAVDAKVIPTTPCITKRINFPKKVKVPVVPLPVRDVGAVTDAMTDIAPQLRAVMVVGWGMGLRQGEAFGLAWDRIDFKRMTVRVDQQVVKPDGVGSRPYVTPKLKSDASYRTLPLPQVVADELMRHFDRFPAGPSGLLFTNADGEPLDRARFNEALDRAVVASGIRPDMTFHELRHWYASALIQAGQSVKVVQARLGHASAMETLDTYGHLWGEDEQGTRDAIDGLFAAA